MRAALVLMLLTACSLPDRNPGQSDDASVSFDADDAPDAGPDAAPDAAPPGCVGDDTCSSVHACFEEVCGGAEVAAIAELCLIRRSGSLWCWGSNQVGQLARPPSDEQLPPTRIELPERVAQVSSNAHVCAVTVTGALWCWGMNAHGELGHAPADDSICGKVRCRPEPTLVGGLPPVKQVTTGGGYSSYTCAVTVDGAAYCWGSNGAGELGRGSRGTPLAPWVPRLVQGMESGVESISASLARSTTCALKTDGTVWCWGRDEFGEVGNDDGPGCAEHLRCAASPLPVRTDVSGAPFGDVVQVEAGYMTSCARKRDGTVWCWGHGAYGLLGERYLDYDRHSAPIQLGTRRASALSMRAYSACTIAEEGGVWCWGLDYAAQLGRGLEPPIPGCECEGEPVLATREPVTALSIVSDVSFALRVDGSVLAWGNNDGGGLGHPRGTHGDVDVGRDLRDTFGWPTPQPMIGIPSESPRVVTDAGERSEIGGDILSSKRRWLFSTDPRDLRRLDVASTCHVKATTSTGTAEPDGALMANAAIERTGVHAAGVAVATGVVSGDDTAATAHAAFDVEAGQDVRFGCSFVGPPGNEHVCAVSWLCLAR